MPELPEVETVRRTLEPSLLGARITDLVVGTFQGVVGDLTPDQLRAHIVGREVVALKRRGKYLLVDFDDGPGREVRLGLTGALTIAQQGGPSVRFEQLAISLESGASLRFAEQPKFGRVLYRPVSSLRPLEGKLG